MLVCGGFESLLGRALIDGGLCNWGGSLPVECDQRAAPSVTSETSVVC